MNNYLMTITNLSKKYAKNPVIKNFSYQFKQTGLYLLFGDSGCGKTTLLNLLSGAIKFDEGIINIGNNLFTNKVNDKYALQNIAYITQSNHFIDYLTIYDNLLLVLAKNKDKKIIDEYLKKLDILKIKNKYPTQISGGEAERLSLLIALLKDYKIILLDEPTSSLDEKTRMIVLDILKDLKTTHLIICATHDEKLKTIADDIIFFPLTSKKNDNVNIVSLSEEKVKKRNLLPFILKKYFSKTKEKKSLVYLSFILISCFLTIFFCYDTHTKIRESLIKYNNINFANFYCHINNQEECLKVLKKYHVQDVTYSYNDNNLELNSHDEYLKETLPFNNDAFFLADKIIYGTYYQKVNDVILGIEAAKSLSPHPENLINTPLTLKMPQGEEEFTIVGILDNLEDNLYAKTLFMGNDSNNKVFLNSEYTKQYLDETFNNTIKYNYDSIFLTAYFENNYDLYAFIKKYDKAQFGDKIAIVPYDFSYTKHTLFIGSVAYYARPIIAITFLITLIFFFQTEYIKNYYQRHILAVYNYFGYSWLKIIINNILATICQVSVVYFGSFLISIILSKILNLIVMKYNILEFIPFLIDYSNSLILYICLIILTIILSFINIMLLRKKGWIMAINEGDDLL